MEWFTSWLTEYLAAFGIVEPAEVKQAALWRNVFLAGAYHETEVRAAARDILANLPALADSPDRFLGKVPMHLAALQRRVRQFRAIEHGRGGHSADQSANERLGLCVLCNSTGRVTVPHPASVRGGKWVGTTGLSRTDSVTFYELAVVCGCAVGNWLLLRLDRGKVRFLTLAEYERHNPQWLAQLAQRRAEDAATRRVSKTPADWEKLKRSLAARFGLRTEAGEEESED